MKKIFGSIIALGLAGALVLGNVTVDTQAADLLSTLPVAGIARTLGEGKSVTAVKADMIKNSSNASVLVSAGVGVDRPSSYNFSTKISTIKETAATADPSIITVGAESATVKETVSENEVLNESANLVVSQNAVSDNEVEESEAADAQTPEDVQANDEKEDFTGLVIAQVNDYVNVRSEASEESEIVGKLYNNSVGELIETAGDWYKIKSGNCVGYVKGEFVVTGQAAQELAEQVGQRMAVVRTTTLYVRSEASTDSEVLGMVPMDDELTVSEELDGWAKVSIEEGDGYVSTEFVELYTDFVHAESKEEEEARLAKEKAAREEAQKAARRAREAAAAAEAPADTGAESAPAATYAPPSGSTGSSVADFALQFVGNPYVYGGSSLTNGTDCSGFVMSVYRNFGISLPHSSGADRNVGYNVGGLANAQPGDIVCYSGHVGIYIGNGQIVHASTAATGIKVSSASYRNVLAVRRIF